MNWKTQQDFKGKIRPPYSEMRSNKFKRWREEFLAVKFCEGVSWDAALICSPDRDEGDDVFIKNGEHCYPFQITELAPKNPEVADVFPQSRNIGGEFMLKPYGSLKDEIGRSVLSLVQAKDNKCYADQESMNILIYINPPNVVVDVSLDIDKEALTRHLRSSKFRTVSLCAGDEIIFIKGDINDLAAVSEQG